MRIFSFGLEDIGSLYKFTASESPTLCCTVTRTPRPTGYSELPCSEPLPLCTFLPIDVSFQLSGHPSRCLAVLRDFLGSLAPVTCLFRPPSILYARIVLWLCFPSLVAYGLLTPGATTYVAAIDFEEYMAS